MVINMKKIKNITILLTIISIAMAISSCKKDKEEPVNDNEPESLVKTLDLDGKQMGNTGLPSQVQMLALGLLRAQSQPPS